MAYVQLLRSHAHVCNAVMAFAALEGQESMAQRVLMYPTEWDEGDEFDGEKAITQGLLRKAASRYKVLLQPISPSKTLRHTDGTEQATFSDEELYPLTNLLSLMHHNRVLYLQPSGLILSSTPLDLLFTYPIPDAKHILGFTSPISSSADRPAALLIEPTRALLKDTMEALPEGSFLDTEFLSLISSRPAPPSTPADDVKPAMLLAETSSLHNVDASFNSTEFLETAGYVHIQDDGVLGPEYAATKAFANAGPPRREARKAWQGVYQRFREGRMDICGLDLEVIAEQDSAGGEDRTEIQAEEVEEPTFERPEDLQNNDGQQNDDEVAIVAAVDPNNAIAEDLGLANLEEPIMEPRREDAGDVTEAEALEPILDGPEHEKIDLRRS